MANLDITYYRKIAKRISNALLNDNFSSHRYATSIHTYYNIPIRVFYGENNKMYIVLYSLKSAFTPCYILEIMRKNQLCGQVAKITCFDLSKERYADLFNTMTDKELCNKIYYRTAPKHILNHYREIWAKKMWALL